MIVVYILIGWFLLGILNIPLRLYVWGYWGPIEMSLLVLAGPCATVVFAIPALMVRQGIYKRDVRLNRGGYVNRFTSRWLVCPNTGESGIKILRESGRMK